MKMYKTASEPELNNIKYGKINIKKLHTIQKYYNIIYLSVNELIFLCVI